MAKGCKKCDPHEICEECPEWIFTLADLIMCMMGLFVILWVLKSEGQQANNQPSEQMIEVLAEIRSAFGHNPDPVNPDAVDRFILEQMHRLKQGTGNKGNNMQEPRGAVGTDPEVTHIRIGPQATIGGRVMFARGQSRIDDDMRRQLDEIASTIIGHRQVILVKGHASLDDLPSTASPQQFQDLSLRRAQAVYDYLVYKGVSPDTLRVYGGSTFEPVVDRTAGNDGYAQNRRVEVESTQTLVDQLRARPPTGKPVD